VGQLSEAEEPVDMHWTVTVVGLIRFGKEGLLISSQFLKAI
jgi:hypothetical protein